jgi:CheY-like chemotaxis protein
MTALLEGCKILVVEDEFLVAMLIQEILEEAGCVVAGPIPRVAQALEAAERDAYDAAVLDVNLAGDRIDPVANALSRRNIPFVFVTGYSAGALPTEYAHRPRLCKPFKMAELLGTLSNLVKPRSPAGSNVTA